MKISGLNSRNKIIINALSSSLQAIIIGVVYFFLYRFLLNKFGADLLGVWSLVLATSSLASVANFGITSSVVRFVSLYNKEDDLESVQRLIFTSVVFMLLLFTAFSVLVYPAATFILSKILDQRYIVIAKQILPFSLICLIVNAVAGVFASVLDGFQKNYIRNIIFTISSLVMLFASYWLSIEYGMKGVAYAQILQSLFTLFVCLFFVISMSAHSMSGFKWDKKIFKDLFSYGMKFQVISIAAMLNEPITKILLVKFGGLIFSGYYEMANRLVMQVRSIIVNANQSLVPVIVQFSDDKNKVLSMFRKTFSIVFTTSLLSMVALCFFSYLICFYWINHLEITFINVIALLSCATFINLLCGPIFFTYVANAELNKLIIFHLILGVSNVILSILLGFLFKSYGVILAWIISILFSFLYLLNTFASEFNFKLIDAVNLKTKVFFIITVVIVIANYIIHSFYINFFKYLINEYLLVAFIFCILSIVFYLTHKLIFKDLKMLLSNKFNNRNGIV